MIADFLSGEMANILEGRVTPACTPPTRRPRRAAAFGYRWLMVVK
jgi:hypothetical protein